MAFTPKISPADVKGDTKNITAKAEKEAADTRKNSKEKLKFRDSVAK